MTRVVHRARQLDDARLRCRSATSPFVCTDAATQPYSSVDEHGATVIGVTRDLEDHVGEIARHLVGIP